MSSLGYDFHFLYFSITFNFINDIQLFSTISTIYLLLINEVANCVQEIIWPHFTFQSQFWNHHPIILPPSARSLQISNKVGSIGADDSLKGIFGVGVWVFEMIWDFLQIKLQFFDGQEKDWRLWKNF